MCVCFVLQASAIIFSVSSALGHITLHAHQHLNSKRLNLHCALNPKRWAVGPNLRSFPEAARYAPVEDLEEPGALCRHMLTEGS